MVLARIVIPLSLSISLESIALSATCSFDLNVEDEESSVSTNVVFPWSTWAIIAIFFIFVMSPLNKKKLLV